jgi:hypothetical protein
MKKSLLILALLWGHWAFAQTYTISGRVAEENQGYLPGATLSLQYPWGEVVEGTVSDVEGRFRFDSIEKGGYVLVVTYLGFEELRGEITLKSENLNLGTLRLEPNSQVLQGVEIKADAVSALQKVDTMEFNSAAFKVMKDADAQELIEKMPGVSVENGQVKSQGENVQQVLVDGKPFFGNDPTAALKNLPAEVIEKVQIFDAQSDQSQFTGFNDGNTVKTINIVTKNGMQNGQFGKAYAGYGYEDKYQAGGNINFFDGDRRISLLGMSNNINVQNFAAEDIVGAMGMSGDRGRMAMRMMSMGGRGGGGGGRSGGGGGFSDFLVNSSGGISTTHALGLNYSDKWGKKVEVSGSYFFNNSENNAENTVFRNFLSSNQEVGNTYQESALSTTNNTNHRLNLRMEWTIDSMNSLLFRPRVTFQQNDGNSLTEGATNDLFSSVLNRSNSSYTSQLTGWNTNGTLLWRHKFAKKGRTFSLEASGGYSPKLGESLLQSENYFPSLNPSPFPILVLEVLNQQGDLSIGSWNAGGNAEWTEPISQNGQLLLNYRYSFQQESSDRLISDWVEATGGYDLLNEPLSNVFSNDYITQQGGLGYNYSKGRDFNVSVRANTQWAELNNQQTFPSLGQVNQTFVNILPSAFIRYNINKNRNIRFNYRSNTQLPSVDQLQNVVNNTNPLQLSSGNSELAQSEQHNIFARYQGVNPARSSSLFFMIGGGFTRDYIGKSTYLAGFEHPIFEELNAQPGAQLTRPVNLDGYANARSFLTYGFPLKRLKSNLNLDASYNFSQTPGLINEARNLTAVHAIGAGFTLGSNISDKVDFTISTRPLWNTTSNSLQTAANTQFWSQNSRVKLNWQIWEGFVLRTDLTHTLYSGLSDGFNQEFYIWNLGIGKKVLKDDRGEITLAVNDLLSQNRSITRTVTEAYIEDARTNALTRFIMLSFTYNLRHFNTGKASSNQRFGGGMPSFF